MLYKQTEFNSIDELLTIHTSFKPTKEFDEWVYQSKNSYPNTIFGINTFFIYGFEHKNGKKIETGSFSINNQEGVVR